MNTIKSVPPPNGVEDWLSPTARRALRGESMSRRELVQVVLELAFHCRELDGDVCPDFFVVLLRPCAAASGIPVRDALPCDELSTICWDVCAYSCPRGSRCSSCGAGMGGDWPPYNQRVIPSKLAHLTVAPTGDRRRDSRSAARANFEAIVEAEWGAD
jgi:hypothetical protein